jgi:hypothetical protein
VTTDDAEPRSDAHEVRLSLGAYVLGALTPVERDRVDEHLLGCPVCTAELDALTTLPLFLDLVPGDEVALMGSEESSPDPRLVDRVVAAALAERRHYRRRRWLTAVAAAVVLIAGSSAAGVLLAPSHHAAQTAGATFQSTDATTHAWAEVQVQPRQWGAALQVQLTGVTPGEHCKLVAVGRDGTSDVAGSWEATYSGRVTVNAATSLQLSSTAAYDVVTFDGRRLVRVPITPASSVKS